MARSRFNFNFKKNKKLFMFLGIALALILILVFLIRRSREKFQDMTTEPSTIDYSCIPIKYEENQKIKSELQSELDNINKLNESIGKPGWLSKYYQYDYDLDEFPNELLSSGNDKIPDVVRIEPQLMFDSRYTIESGYNIFNNLPLKENFASTHVTFFKPTIDGNYTIRLNSDDGSSLYIDNVIKIENDRVGPMSNNKPESDTTRSTLEPSTSKSINVKLKANTEYRIQVNYFQKMYFAGLEVTFRKPNVLDSTLPLTPLVGVSKIEDKDKNHLEYFNNRKIDIESMLKIKEPPFCSDYRESGESQSLINLTLKNILNPNTNEYYDTINRHFRFPYEMRSRNIKSNDLTLGSFYFPRGRKEVHVRKFNTITIPNTIKTIGENAFLEHILNKVLFKPDSKLETIDKYAFRLSTLKEITIPESVTTIGEGAFAVTNLEDISIPESVQTIGKRAFSNTTLRNVTIYSELYDSLNPLSNYFSNRNKDTIEFNIIDNSNDSTTTTYTLSHSSNQEDTLLLDMHGPQIGWEKHAKYVPSVPDELYKALSINQLINTNTLTIPEGIEVIHDYAFYNTDIEKVIIPKSVKDIRYHPFYTTSLSEVVFKDRTFFEKLKNETISERVLTFEGTQQPGEGFRRTLLADIKNTTYYGMPFDRLNKLYQIFGKMTSDSPINYPDNKKTGSGQNTKWGPRSQYKYSLPVFKDENGNTLYPGSEPIRSFGTRPVSSESSSIDPCAAACMEGEGQCRKVINVGGVELGVKCELPQADGRCSVNWTTCPDAPGTNASDSQRSQPPTSSPSTLLPSPDSGSNTGSNLDPDSEYNNNMPPPDLNANPGSNLDPASEYNNRLGEPNDQMLNKDVWLQKPTNLFKIVGNKGLNVRYGTDDIKLEYGLTLEECEQKLANKDGTMTYMYTPPKAGVESSVYVQRKCYLDTRVPTYATKSTLPNKKNLELDMESLKNVPHRTPFISTPEGDDKLTDKPFLDYDKIVNYEESRIIFTAFNVGNLSAFKKWVQNVNGNIVKLGFYSSTLYNTVGIDDEYLKLSKKSIHIKILASLNVYNVSECEEQLINKGFGSTNTKADGFTYFPMKGRCLFFKFLISSMSITNNSDEVLNELYSKKIGFKLYNPDTNGYVYTALKRPTYKDVSEYASKELAKFIDAGKPINNTNALRIAKEIKRIGENAKQSEQIKINDFNYQIQRFNDQIQSVINKNNPSLVYTMDRMPWDLSEEDMENQMKTPETLLKEKEETVRRLNEAVRERKEAEEASEAEKQKINFEIIEASQREALNKLARLKNIAKRYLPDLPGK